MCVRALCMQTLFDGTSTPDMSSVLSGLLLCVCVCVDLDSGDRSISADNGECVLCVCSLELQCVSAVSHLTFRFKASHLAGFSGPLKLH